MKHDTRIERMFETNQQFHDRKESQARLSFERKVVRKLLDIGGVDALQRRVMESKWSSDENRDFYLTFGWFADEYPNFPFIMTASEQTWVPRAVEIFKRTPRSHKLWRMWRSLKAEFSKEVLQDKQIALVIPCSQESGLHPALVMHNGHLSDGPFKDAPKDQIHVRLLDERTGETVFLQMLGYFSAQVALQWQA